MDDYSVLAQRIAFSVAGVRGSLLLSRDGLALGSYPDDDDSLVKPAWLRFASLGEPERSFVEFHDQVWAFVKRGSYGAFCVAEPGTRPGVLVDQMEQVLLTAEEGRVHRDAVRLPDAASAPTGRPRTSLHASPGRPQPEPVLQPVAEPARETVSGVVPIAEAVEAVPTDEAAPTDEGHWRRSSEEPRPAFAGGVDGAHDGGAASGEGQGPQPPAASDPQQPPSSNLRKEPQKLVSSVGRDDLDDDSEIDRVLLAKEFSGLLQVDSADDEGSS